MEIKHTIEILTKDIQDIENLVRNLNNYPSPPQIELELAMSKLRRVYDLLSTISYDIKSDFMKMQEKENVKPEEENPEPPAVLENQTAQEQEEKISPHAKSEPVPSLIPPEATIPAKEVAESLPVEPQEQEVIQPVHENVESEKVEAKVTEARESEILFPKTAENKIQDPTINPKQQKEASILAEKFEKDKSLNEKIATAKNSDIISKIKGGPIDSIKRNIGINDRFLIIREIMNGDNEGFNQLVQQLDDCGNFNDAFKRIESRFPENLEHEGVKLLIDLSRRKFISSGNV